MSSDLTNTAPPKWLDELRSPIESLPTDLVAASGRRVRMAALAFAAVWVVMLVLANPLARLMTGDHGAPGLALSTLVLILPIDPAIAPIPFRWLAIAAFLSASMDPLTWGSYTLGKLLGKGGMGEVYEATHRLLARKAAVELVTRQEDEEPGANERALERFRREAADGKALLEALEPIAAAQPWHQTDAHRWWASVVKPAA